MIKPEQIPDEVVEELHAIFADDFGTLIPKGSCRAAIAAMLNAWPNGNTEYRKDSWMGYDGNLLILPVRELLSEEIIRLERDKWV